MSVEIKSMAEIAGKWTRVTPGRTQDYVEGVKNPRKDWQAATSAAEDRFEQGVQEAISQKRFGKGVRDAGTSKWQDGAVKKGGTRWGPGVSQAGPAYQAGFEPYRNIIANTTLPPRFAKGDPRNLERVRILAENLHAAKIT